MSQTLPPPAWVALPDQTELRAAMPSGHPYDFGFLPTMAGLIMAHRDLGPAFGLLFAQIMFAPGSLDRREREMVAAVTAAAQDCFY